MKRIKLSVCIPTYNRSTTLDKTLRYLLVQNLQKVEIIVSDNASDDNTKSVVNSFRSDRIKYYRNDYNMGFTLNLLISMRHASGEFLVLLSDEDDLNIAGILDFIEKDYCKALQSSAILGGVLIGNRKKYYYENRLLKPGIFNLRVNGFRRTYISGIILNSKYIEVDNYIIQASKNNNGYLGIFPHTAILNEMMLQHNVLTSQTIFSSIRDLNHSNIVSGTSSWVHPSGRINQFSSDILFFRKEARTNSFFVYFLLSLYRYRVTLGYIASFILQHEKNTYDYYLNSKLKGLETYNRKTYVFYRNKLKTEFIQSAKSFNYCTMSLYYLAERLISIYTLIRFRVYKKLV